MVAKCSTDVSEYSESRVENFPTFLRRNVRDDRIEYFAYLPLAKLRSTADDVDEALERAREKSPYYVRNPENLEKWGRSKCPKCGKRTKVVDTSYID